MGKAKKHQRDVQKETLGKKVLCVGVGGALYQCQNSKCLTVKRKGIFLEYNNKIYCTEECIKSEVS
jgi:hypothetical protein